MAERKTVTFFKIEVNPVGDTTYYNCTAADGTYSFSDKFDKDMAQKMHDYIALHLNEPIEISYKPTPEDKYKVGFINSLPGRITKPYSGGAASLDLSPVLPLLERIATALEALVRSGLEPAGEPLPAGSSEGVAAPPASTPSPSFGEPTLRLRPEWIAAGYWDALGALPGPIKTKPLVFRSIIRGLGYKVDTGLPSPDDPEASAIFEAISKQVKV